MWLNELTGNEKESVFAAMRSIRSRSDRSLEQARRLLPPGYRLPRGGEHFDLWLKGETLAELLRLLNKGNTPEQAAIDAKSYASAIVTKWNANPEALYFWNKAEVSRWEKTMDDPVDTAVREIRESVKSAESVTINVDNFKLVRRAGLWEVSQGDTLLSREPSVDEAMKVVDKYRSAEGSK